MWVNISKLCSVSLHSDAAKVFLSQVKPITQVFLLLVAAAIYVFLAL